MRIWNILRTMNSGLGWPRLVPGYTGYLATTSITANMVAPDLVTQLKFVIVRGVESDRSIESSFTDLVYKPWGAALYVHAVRKCPLRGNA
jgi:hypothetical protein